MRLLQPEFTPDLRRQAFLRAGVVIAVIAWVDAIVVPNFSIGFLYFLPLLLAGGFLTRLDIAALSLICVVLKEQFSSDPWGPGLVARSVISTVGFLASALFMREVERNQNVALIHAAVAADQTHRRETAERLLRSFIEGSPAAIVTLDNLGRIDLANEAAHEMMGFDPPALSGRTISDFLPAVATLQRSTGRTIRTSMECTGYRGDGEAFSAQVWVSGYGDPAIGGLGLVIFDGSEQLRSREEGRLQYLTASARVILGSFWHETRNFCTALRLTTVALKRIPGVDTSEEIVAMGSLVEGLEKMSMAELRPSEVPKLAEEDCASVRVTLDHVRIVVEPWFRERGIRAEWRIENDLPLARADQHALLQVFLNLARNAEQALAQVGNGHFLAEAVAQEHKVLVRFRNNGPPVLRPDTLFRPFQPEAAGSGIGLFVSRAMLRSFGGDLRHETVDGQTCFIVSLEAANWFLNVRNGA